MTNRIRIIKHEVTLDCGSYEVQIPDRPNKYFYWDDVQARGSGRMYWSVIKLLKKQRLRHEK